MTVWCALRKAADLVDHIPMNRNLFARFAAAVVATTLLLFLPAGTLAWWQAWIYLPLFFFVPMALIARYLVQRDRELLRRRLQTKEIKPGQRLIAALFYASIGIAFVIAGFDRRLGWSDVPQAATIVAALLFLAGYALLFLVFKTNTYLAHTVRVEEHQRVVTTGSYAWVRHPMYLAQIVMFLSTPPALGSLWALASAIPLIAAMVLRIVTEERVLLRELKGYGDYTRITRYRIIPGVW